MGITRKIVCTIGPSCEKSPILRKTRVYEGVLPLLVGKGILSRDSNTAIVLELQKRGALRSGYRVIAVTLGAQGSISISALWNISDLF